MESVTWAILIFIGFSLLAGVVHGIALNLDFFKIQHQEPKPQDGRLLLFVITSFFLLSKLLPLWILQLFSKNLSLLDLMMTEPTMKMLSYSISSLLTIYLILLITKSQRKQQLIDLIGFQKEQVIYQIKQGIYAFLLAMSSVTAIGVLLQLLTFFFFKESGNEQSIITYLREHHQTFGVKFLGFLNIVLFAPALEELVFRGFIQNYFRKFSSPKKAILLTSSIFAFVHFSLDQGVANLALISCIFVLSCYLGFIYEKTHGIIAPIVVHMLFNLDGISRIFIFM
jgi:membrane protease YdiL (CAAX protease family)